MDLKFISPHPHRLFPRFPIDFVSASPMAGTQKCPVCGCDKITDCIYGISTYLCGFCRYLTTERLVDGKIVDSPWIKSEWLVTPCQGTYFEQFIVERNEKNKTSHQEN